MQNYSPATIRAYDLVRREAAFSGLLPDAVEPTRLLVARIIQIAQEYSEDDLSGLAASIDTAFTSLHAHLVQQIEGIATNLPLVQSAANDLISLKKIRRGSEDNVINSCFGSLRYQAADLMAGAIGVSFLVMNRFPDAASLGATLDAVRDDFEYFDAVSDDPARFARLLSAEVDGYTAVPEQTMSINDLLEQYEDIISEITSMISKENNNIILLKDNLLTISKTQSLISLQRSGFAKDILDRVLSPVLLKELNTITKAP